MTYIWLLVGFILLIKGADLFVNGSSGIAKIFHVPSIIIGLTIVAMGTSLPECAVSITAALKGNNDIAVSNVVGSNFFNLLVVCGVCSIIKPLPIDQRTLKKEFPFSIAIGFLLLLLSADFLLKGKKSVNCLSIIDGVILLILFLIFLGFMIQSTIKAQNDFEKKIESNECKENKKDKPKMISCLLCIVFITIGIVAIKYGGDLVVDSASDIAEGFGLSQNLIGLTIVAVGTSLPELVTSIVAARKGESAMALGNVVGSNIFNVLLVLGISSLIHPIAVSANSIYDLIFLGVTSIVVWFFAYTKEKLVRWHGFIMIGLYVGYMIYVCMR